MLSKIESNQIDFSFANKDFGIQKVVIHQNVSLYFRIENQKIYLITFFNNRMNPETLNKLLNT